LPQIVEEALDAMNNVPAYIKKTNNGKGIPLEFGLISFGGLEEILCSTPTPKRLGFENRQNKQAENLYVVDNVKKRPLKYVYTSFFRLIEEVSKHTVKGLSKRFVNFRGQR